MLSVERSGLPPALVAALKHLASLHNPEFYEKQRMRFSTWDTPRFIACYEEDLQWLHLPRGLIEQAVALVADEGSRLEIEDRRSEPEPIDLVFHGTLRPAQVAALDAVAGQDHAVLVAPPGAGKTVMACAAIAHHRVPTLVLVDRTPLVDQWRERLGRHLGLDPSQIGQIGGGKNKPSGVVDVAMLQTVARDEDCRSMFSRYGLVIVDECHHLPAVSFDASVRHAPVKRWLGLTATPYRRDGLEGIIFFQCGPTRHEIPIRGDESVLLRRDLIVHETTTTTTDDQAGIQQIFGMIVDDPVRTAQICSDIHAALEQKRTCLVLTQRTDHIDSIVANLTALGHVPLVLKGGLGKKATAAVMAQLADPKPEVGVVLVATGSYLGEGFDWPACDTLFLAFPLAFKGRVVQYVGRLLRTDEGKQRVELHDYVDVGIPVLDRMHDKRRPVYATLGFDVPKRPTRRRTATPAAWTDFEAF